MKKKIQLALPVIVRCMLVNNVYFRHTVLFNKQYVDREESWPMIMLKLRWLMLAMLYGRLTSAVTFVTQHVQHDLFAC